MAPLIRRALNLALLLFMRQEQDQYRTESARNSNIKTGRLIQWVLLPFCHAGKNRTGLIKRRNSKPCPMTKLLPVPLLCPRPHPSQLGFPVDGVHRHKVLLQIHNSSRSTPTDPPTITRRSRRSTLNLSLLMGLHLDWDKARPVSKGSTSHSHYHNSPAASLGSIRRRGRRAVLSQLPRGRWAVVPHGAVREVEVEVEVEVEAAAGAEEREDAVKERPQAVAGTSYRRCSRAKRVLPRAVWLPRWV